MCRIFLAITGALSLGCLAGLVFHMAKGHIASPGLRALLAAGMVLLPVANVELLNDVVNVPWWFFFAAFWALLWRPRSWPGRTCAALVCFMAAASEALVALFLPLAVARAVVLPRRQEQAATGGLVLGLLYQAVVILPAGAKALSSPGGIHDVGQSFAVRVGLGMVGGVKGTDWLVVQARGASTALGLVVVGAVIGGGVCARSPRVRIFTLVAAAYSAVCFVVPVWLRDVATVMQIGTVRLAGRYQAVPVLLLTSALLVLADHFAREGGTRTLQHSTWKTKSPQALPRRSVVAADGMRGSLNSELGGGLPGAQPAFIGAAMGDRGGQSDRRLPAASGGRGHAVDRPPRIGPSGCRAGWWCNRDRIFAGGGRNQ